MTLLSGKQVTTFRRRLSLSQRDLAARLGVNQATVSRWEQALTAPSAEVWDRLFSLRYGHGVLRSAGITLLVGASDQRRALLTREMVVVQVSRGMAQSLGRPADSLGGLAYRPLLTPNLLDALAAAHGLGMFDGAPAGLEVWGHDRSLLGPPLTHHSFWTVILRAGPSPLLYWDILGDSFPPDTPSSDDGGFRPHFLEGF